MSSTVTIYSHYSPVTKATSDISIRVSYVTVIIPLLFAMGVSVSESLLGLFKTQPRSHRTRDTSHISHERVCMSILWHSSSMLWTQDNQRNQLLLAEPMELAKEAKKDLTPVGRSSTTSHMTPLPLDFEPSDDDVICGRGKKCYTHIGNERFRKTVVLFLKDYSLAKSKVDKSAVLSRVVDEVRRNSPSGGFVKQDAKGVWHEVGDFLAREKTSQAFRDALHERYKSSNISKKKRRQEEQAKASVAEKSSSAAEFNASSRIERLSREVMGNSLEGIDDFNRRNYEMLSLQTAPLPMHRSLPQEQESSRNSYSTSSFRHQQMRDSDQHFPDPLFGSSQGRFYDKEARPQERFDEYPRRRQFSFGSAPETSTEPLDAAAQSDNRSFANSLPDIPMFIRSSGRDMFDEDLSIRSVPEMAFSTHGTGRIESDRITTRDIEPIPLKNINLHVPKKVDNLLEGEAPPAKLEDDHIPPSSVRTAKLSRDLVECLGKMTYHTMGEGSLFEPIPLSTKSADEDDSEQTKPAATYAPSSVHKSIFNQDLMMYDESEQDDEFAEG